MFHKQAFYEGTNPIHWVSTLVSWSLLKDPHILILSHWGVRISVGEFWENENIQSITRVSNSHTIERKVRSYVWDFYILWYIIHFIRLYSCSWSVLLFSLMGQNTLVILKCTHISVCVYNKSRWLPFLRLLRALCKTLTSNMERNFFFNSSTMTSFNKYLVNRSIFLLEKKCNPSSFFPQNMSGRKDFLICNLQLH